jgi:hypothetical protein
MGQKISDGKAFNLTVPDDEVVNDYDLYRVNGVNGVAIGALAADDDARTLAFEADTNAIYSVKVPAFIDPDPGDVLFWHDQTQDFQAGATDLRGEPAASGDQACFWCSGAKNDAGYIQGRVLNGVPAPVSVVS